MKISNIMKYMNKKQITDVYYDSAYHETNKLELIEKLNNIDENAECSIILNYYTDQIEFNYYKNNKYVLSFQIMHKRLFELFSNETFLNNLYYVNKYNISIIKYKKATLSFKDDENNNIKVETKQLKEKNIVETAVCDEVLNTIFTDENNNIKLETEKIRA